MFYFLFKIFLNIHFINTYQQESEPSIGMQPFIFLIKDEYNPLKHTNQLLYPLNIKEYNNIFLEFSINFHYNFHLNSISLIENTFQLNKTNITLFKYTKKMNCLEEYIEPIKINLSEETLLENGLKLTIFNKLTTETSGKLEIGNQLISIHTDYYERIKNNNKDINSIENFLNFLEIKKNIESEKYAFQFFIKIRKSKILEKLLNKQIIKTNVFKIIYNLNEMKLSSKKVFQDNYHLIK